MFLKFYSYKRLMQRFSAAFLSSLAILTLEEQSKPHEELGGGFVLLKTMYKHSCPLCSLQLFLEPATWLKSLLHSVTLYIADLLYATINTTLQWP